MTELNEKNFTKADFMTPTQAARKLNADPDIVAKKMLEQYRKGTKIVLGMTRRTQPMVYKMSTIGGSIKDTTHTPLRLHPLALNAFREILERGDEK